MLFLYAAGIYFCAMNVLKWLGYFVLLGLFVWFVFFRKLNANAAKPVVNNSETIDAPINDGEAEMDQISDDSFVAENIESSAEPADFPAVSEVDKQAEQNKNTEQGAINLNQKYLIVVGSFGKKSNADKMLKRVKKDGNDAVITQVNNLHRVITASTDDLANAKRLRDHFTHIYKETAFILEN